MTTDLQLLVTFENTSFDSRPWRRVRVPADTTLAGLHLAIQRMIGAQGHYYYEFAAGGVIFAPAIEETVPDWQEKSPLDVSSVTLAEVFRGGRTRLCYEYDFQSESCSHYCLRIDLEHRHQDVQQDRGLELVERHGEFLNNQGEPLLWEGASLNEYRNDENYDQRVEELLRKQQERSRDEPGMICTREWVYRNLEKGAHLPTDVELEPNDEMILDDMDTDVFDLETGEESHNEVPELWIPETLYTDVPQITRNEPHTLFMCTDYVFEALTPEILDGDWEAAKELVVDDLLEEPPAAMPDGWLYSQVVTVCSLCRIEYRRDRADRTHSLRLAPEYEHPDDPSPQKSELTEYQQQMLNWIAGFDGYVNTELLAVGGWDGDRPDWLQLDGNGPLADLRRKGLVELEPMKFGQREIAVASVPDRHDSANK